MGLIGLFSCQPDDGSDGANGANGLNSLIASEIELSGSNCPAGGLQFNYGLDLNSNGILDLDEVQNSNFICNGDSGNLELDNLVRLELGSPDVSTCGNEWFMTEFETFMLHDFNKLDYQNVNSILFVPSMHGASNANGYFVVAELFNVTDNVPIANTQLTHDNTNYVFKYSENIYDYLPDYPVTLAIRIRVEDQDLGICGGLGYVSYLYILRE